MNVREFLARMARTSLLGLAEGCTGQADDYCCLKRLLSIFSALIFDSSVEEGSPSCDAAPNGPDTRPLHSIKAVSMASFSCVVRFRGRRSEEHTSELQSRVDLVCWLLLEKKNKEYIASIIRQRRLHEKRTPECRGKA